MNRFISLRRAFYTIILPIISLLSLGLLFLTLYGSLQSRYEVLSAKIENQLDKAIYRFDYPLWNVNYNLLASLGSAQLIDTDTRGISIFDENGNPVFSEGANRRLSRESLLFLARQEHDGYPGPDLFFKTVLSSLLPFLLYDPVSIVGFREINYETAGKSINVGSVFLTFTDEAIQRDLRKNIRQQIIFTLFIFLMIALFISVAYQIIIQRPLGELKASIDEWENKGLSENPAAESRRLNDLNYIRERFEGIWKVQDRILRELHESREYYKALLNNIPVGVVLAEGSGILLDSNRMFSKLTGYNQDRSEKRTFRDFTSPRYWTDGDIFMDKLKNSGSSSSFEIPILSAGGKEIPVKLNGAALTREGQNLYLISVEDMTEMVQMESELRKSYRFLNTASRIALVGGWEMDLPGRSLSLSSEVCTILELDENINHGLEEFTGFFHEEYETLVKQAFERSCSVGEPFELEAKLITAGKREIWVLLKGLPRLEEGNLAKISGMLQDITNRKKTEEEYLVLQKELGHKSRLDMIGQLASGIAHDFNNILNGIISSAELLNLRMTGQTEGLEKYTRIIINQAENASRLSRRLLALSRKENYIKKMVDLNDLLGETADILKNTLDRKISVLLDAGDVSHAFIDYSSMQNALMNICINSSHAMPEGGTISIAKTPATDREGNPMEKIVIADTGKGIPREIIGSIFEPFFTTKKDGTGTGLGLSAVKRTVEDHNGTISVESTPGKGTAMTILLPSLERGGDEPAAEEKAVMGKGTILLVDDEEMNRITGKEILETLGYSVLLAGNGVEALEIYRESGSRIDLVLLDMIMPVMDGFETFYKIKELNMNCRIAVISGYPDKRKLDMMRETGLEAVIGKPFLIPQLSKTISEILP